MAHAGRRLVAGLIVALAAAGAAPRAAADTPLARLARTLAPGQWAELRTEGNDIELFRAGHQHILQYTDDAVWHPASQQLLFIGQGHISPPLKFVVYAARTNRWRLMPTPPWAVGVKWGHAYDNNAIDAERGIFYHHRSRSRRLQAYDIAAERWRALPEDPKLPRGHGSALAFFPEMDALVRVLGGHVHLFEVGPQRWRELGPRLEMGRYHNFAKYARGHRAVLLGGGNESRAVYILRANGRSARLADSPVPIGINSSRATTVDPVSGDLLVLSRSGTLHALDVLRDRWRLVSRTTPITSKSVIATPVSDHGVVLFATIRPEKVYLYRHDPDRSVGQ